MVYSFIKKGGKKTLDNTQPAHVKFGSLFLLPSGKTEEGETEINNTPLSPWPQSLFVCCARRVGVHLYACHVFVLVISHAPLINTLLHEEGGRCLLEHG